MYTTRIAGILLQYKNAASASINNFKNTYESRLSTFPTGYTTNPDYANVVDKYNNVAANLTSVSNSEDKAFITGMKSTYDLATNELSLITKRIDLRAAWTLFGSTLTQIKDVFVPNSDLLSTQRTQAEALSLYNADGSAKTAITSELSGAVLDGYTATYNGASRTIITKLIDNYDTYRIANAPGATQARSATQTTADKSALSDNSQLQTIRDNYIGCTVLPIGHWLLLKRLAQNVAVTNFTTLFGQLTPTQYDEYQTSSEYSAIRTANASSESDLIAATNLSTVLSGSADIAATLAAFDTKISDYNTASTALPIAVTRSRLLQAAKGLDSGVLAIGDIYVTTADISGNSVILAGIQAIPTVLTADKSAILASITDATTIDNYINNTFMPAAIQLMTMTLSAYNTYRNTFVTDEAILADARTQTAVNSDISGLSISTVVATRDQYIGNFSTGFWPVLRRLAVRNAIKTFQDSFTSLNPPQYTEYSSSTEYDTAMQANTDAVGDRDTNLPALTTITAIDIMRTKYSTALVDMQKAVKRSRIRKAISDFTGTKSAVSPAYFPITDMSGNAQINAANSQLTLLLETDGTLKSTVTDDTQVPTFEAATKALLILLLDKYKTYRTANADTYTDITQQLRSDTDVDGDKTALGTATASQVLQTRANYIADSTSYWPTLQRLATKTSSRVSLLNSLTAFVLYYNKFSDLRADVATSPPYTNADLQRIFTDYVDTSYIPTANFLSQDTAVLDGIKGNYDGAYFTNLVNDMRGYLKGRVDTFNTRYSNNQSIIAASEVSVPTELIGLPTTSDFLDSLGSTDLVTQKTAYYGDPTAPANSNTRKGRITLLEELITAAILENKRRTTFTAIRNFEATYTASAPYIPTSTFNAVIAKYQDLIATYKSTATQARTTDFLAIPIGSATDAAGAITETTAVTSLFQLQYIYEVCTRGVVSVIVQGLKTAYQTQATLSRPWSPAATLVTKATSTPPTAVEDDDVTIRNAATTMSDVMIMRDEYVGSVTGNSFWAQLLTAANQQVADQITVWNDLKSLADDTHYAMPLTGDFTNLNRTADTPTASTKYFDLSAVYVKYDTAGQSTVTDMKTWIKARISEYTDLYQRYGSFEIDTFVKAVRPAVATLASASFIDISGVLADTNAVDGYTFYTIATATPLKTLVVAKLADYVDPPAGHLPRLKTFVRGQLDPFIEDFKTAWTASTSETREDYTTYDADKGIVGNASASVADLKTVMGNYSTYSDELREANLQQSVLIAMRDFNNAMYLDNVAILNVDSTTARGSRIAAAQRDITGSEGEDYITRILADAINNKTELARIREVYFQASFDLADQIVEDLNSQQDTFASLFDAYNTFLAMERNGELAAPATVRGSIVTTDISSNKIQLTEKAAALQATNADPAKESIMAQVADFVGVVNSIRQSLVEGRYVDLRQDIKDGLRLYIESFKSKYDAIAVSDVKDPYITYTDDRDLVKSDAGLPTTGQLTSLIANYTTYTEDLVTSNFQVRTLRAIENFFTKLYGANAAILPARDDMGTTGSVSAAVLQAIDNALDTQTLISNVAAAAENEDRTSLTSLRTEFVDAADAFAPYVVAQLRTYITAFDTPYLKYVAFFTANQTARNGGNIFFANLAGHTLTNNSAGQRVRLDGFGPPTGTYSYSEPLRQAIDDIRDAVLGDTATLRTFMRAQLTAYVDYFAGQYTAASTAGTTTLDANIPGYSATTTKSADMATISTAGFDTMSEMMDTYRTRTSLLVVSQKQQALLNAIDLFSTQLLAPNLSFLPPIPTGTTVALYNDQADGDKIGIAVTLPALTGLDTDAQIAALSEYASNIDDLKGNYEAATQDLLGMIRSALTTAITRFKDLYRPNKIAAVLKSTIPASVTTANAALDADEGSVGSVTDPATINTLRDRYTTALNDIFPLVKTDFIDYIDEMNDLAGKYTEFRDSNSWALESSTNQLLTNFQNVAENTIDLPDKTAIESTVTLTTTFIQTIDSLRTTVVLGSLPQLRTFVRDQLRTYIPYFKTQYDTISASETKEAYTTYATDFPKVAATATISTDDLKGLLAAYKTYTADLVTANLQYRVVVVLRNFVNLLVENWALIQTPPLAADIRQGQLDAVGTTDASGIAFRIANNISNEIMDRDELLVIESRYTGLLSALTPVVRDAVIARVKIYGGLRAAYAAFLAANRTRFATFLGALDTTAYPDSAVADEGTLTAYTSYSTSFVDDVNRIREAALLRAEGLRAFVREQMVSYVSAFGTEWAATPVPPNRNTNLAYSLAKKGEDEGTVGNVDISVDDLKELMMAYTLNTSLLLLSRKEEEVCRAIEAFRTLYQSNEIVVPTAAERTNAVVSLAATAAADLSGAAASKGVAAATDPSAAFVSAMESLDTTLDSYKQGTTAWIAILKTRIATDLGAYRDLYTTYTAFDGTFSRYYDISGLPTGLAGANYTAVSDLSDAAGFAANTPVAVASVTAVMDRLRLQYYYDPADSAATLFRQIPMLVRSVKAQMRRYINQYSGDYGDLPANLKPICNLAGGSAGPCIDTAANLAYVLAGTYESVGDLGSLKTMIDAYITNTPSIESAIRVNIRRIETRDLIGQFATTRTYVLEGANSLEYKYLARNVDSAADLAIVDQTLDLSGVNAINFTYSSNITKLCFDVIWRFSRLYIQNRYLEPYFIQAAVEVYNTYRVNIYTDIAEAFDNLTAATDYTAAVETNPIQGNITMAKNYADLCKTILDNTGTAESEYQTVQEYKAATKRRINDVEKEWRDLSGLRGLTLPPAIAGLDASGARTIVDEATYIADMKPTKDAYDGYFTVIRTRVHKLVEREIDAFKTTFDSFGSLRIYFSNGVQRARTDLDAATNDRTAVGPVEGATAVDAADSRKLVLKYRFLRRRVARQSVLLASLIPQLQPKIVEGFQSSGEEDLTLIDEEDEEIDPADLVDLEDNVAADGRATDLGFMFRKAKSMTGQLVDRYMNHVGLLAPVGGGILLQNPKVGSTGQVTVQGKFDKGKIAATDSPQVLLNYKDTYDRKEADLLDVMFEYAAKVIDDGFIAMYSTIEEKGLIEYVPTAMQTAKAEVESNRRKITDKSLTFEQLRPIIELYVGLSANVALEVKRAEVRKLLTEVRAFLVDIDRQNTGIVFSEIVPTLDQIDTVLRNINTVKAIGILQQTHDQYTTIQAAVKAQYAGFAAEEIRKFREFYAEAEKDKINSLLPATVKTLSRFADADATSLDTKTNAEIADIAKKYKEQRLLGQQKLAVSANDIQLLKNKNATQLAGQTFIESLRAARTIPALVTDLADIDAQSSTDSDTIDNPSVPIDTLVALQKKLTDLNNQVVAKVRRALQDVLVGFSKALTAAQAKKATIPTRVRTAPLIADTKRVEVGVTVLEMRDMLRNYAELTALLTTSLPAATDLTGARAEVLQMILTFETLMGSTTGLRLSAQVTGATPATDRQTASAATDLTVLTGLRVKYLQMTYEVNSKIDEARTASATALATKKTEALAAIAAFESTLGGARINLAEYPQVVAARDAIIRNRGTLANAATTVETAETIRTTYTTARDAITYGQATLSSSERASTQQAALTAMTRFTNLYAANADKAAVFSADLRAKILTIPMDVQTVQNPTTAFSALSAIRAKYDDLRAQVLTELSTVHQDRVAEAVNAVRNFSTAYGQLTGTQRTALPYDLRNIDSRLIDADLATLQTPAADTAPIYIKYTGYANLITQSIPNFSQLTRSTREERSRAMQVLRELNGLFTENMGLFGRLTPQLRSRIQQIGEKMRFLGGRDVGAEEVRGIQADYKQALADFKAILAGSVPTPGTIDASLRAILEAFQAKYAQADIYKLGKEDFNYVQLLLRNQSNSYVIQDTQKAIRAFSKGIDILDKVPRITGDVVMNTRYNTLLETMNYFISELGIRNMGRAIPTDRLYINNLKNNVAAYTDMYKVPKPNMRNYDQLVDGLVDQYRQGLRILRTYPMKT